MSTIKYAHLARLDMEGRLINAIANWRPDRPLRWLAKYGNIVADGRAPWLYNTVYCGVRLKTY